MIVIDIDGEPLLVSPPINSTLYFLAQALNPFANFDNQKSSGSRIYNDSRAYFGIPPMATISEIFTASDFKPK